jgi:hypothetical protein
MTYDVAMDIRLFPRMVQDVKTKFPPGKSQYSNILGFGHIGDGVKTIIIMG